MKHTRPLLYLWGVDSDDSAIAQCLGDADYKVLAFDRDQSLTKAIKATPPALVLVDADTERLRMVQQIRQQSNCLLLVVTTVTSEVDCLISLAAGADDYLVKPFSCRELLARIGALFRRLERQKSPAEQSRSKRGIEYRGLFLDIDRKVLSRGSRAALLTPCEFYILNRMMAFPTRTFSRQSLLEPPVSSRGKSSRTADMHIANLRVKIAELEPGFDVLLTVRGKGYRWSHTE